MAPVFYVQHLYGMLYWRPAALYDLCRIAEYFLGEHLSMAIFIGTENDDELIGAGDDDTLIGLGGVDTLIGGGGNDTMDGGLGADTMIGGAGDDLYFVDNIGDVVTEEAGEGIDTVRSAIKAYTLSDNVENLTLVGTLAVTGTGNDLDNVLIGSTLNNTLIGGAGNDTLDGFGGKDRLIGGTGNDTYIVNATGATIVEIAGEGIDTVISGLKTYTLGNHIERLQLAGSAVTGVGNALDNVLTGNGDNNTLDGKAGADTMLGGLGDDVYIVDNVNDVVTEYFNEGIDTVRASVSYTLSSNVENITLTGTAAINAMGNGFDNYMLGNAAANILNGGDGNDTLDGGKGIDTLIGGTGNDVYYVDVAGDVVVEDAGEGTDLVYSVGTYTLGANIENLFITGAGKAIASGNDLDNHIKGGKAADTLYGFEGNDTLDGGAGADTLVGGLGDDTYHVDLSSDVVIEVAGEGTDTVYSSAASYTLSANVENLVLTAAAISGKGNAGDNTITGNAGNNTLEGGGGLDTLIGGTGDDRYIITSFTDVVIENAGEGTDTVQTTLDNYTLMDEVENLVLAGTTAINGNGNNLNNTIFGNAAVNTMAGGLGNDSYVVTAGDVVIEEAGEGTDTIITAISWTLGANIENLTMSGGNGTGNDLDNVIISTSTASNTLIGLEGDDYLDGGAGNDVMIGGIGNDTYVVSALGDIIVEEENEGIDTVRSGLASYTLGANLENLVLTGSGHINGNGNSLDNLIVGNAGNNVLNGGTGTDTLQGGAGNDTYIVDDNADVVIENAGEGTDVVQSTASDYTLSENIETLILMGTADINGTGNSGDNTLIGNAGVNILDGGDGDDTLIGGMGADTLIGGDGNDVFIVDNIGDIVIEDGANVGDAIDYSFIVGKVGVVLKSAQHLDVIESSVTYTMPTNVEVLRLTGTANINAFGNDDDNVLIGNAGANTLEGMLGNDTYVVTDTRDTLIERAGEGIDTVASTISYTLLPNFENLILIEGFGNLNATGNSAANYLEGNEGNNTLNGMAGGDLMFGGAGNDVYIVDDYGDLVFEEVNEGIDTVYSSVSFALPDDVEKLFLTGTDDLFGIGNALANSITGNAGDNVIDGGGGADVMAGGQGNDTYYVDNTGDKVTEAANAGIDHVNASVSFILGANIETLTLTGIDNIDGIGNNLVNTIVGNSGNNTLDGKAGADTMIGGAGNDVYIVDNIGDVIIEDANEGIDTVQSSLTWVLDDNFENLTLTGKAAINGTGNALDNIITGNAGKNTLSGLDGNDTLISGGGADTLIGGTGNDTYVISTLNAVLIEGVGEGTDTVESSVSWTLQNNFENLTLTGTAAINGTGNAVVNTIVGNSANNTLDGGLGADTMIGGGGDDVYIVDDTNDFILELSGGGTDTVRASANYALTSHTENLTLTGSAVSGMGNELANTLIGTAGANILDGGEGDDYIDGGAGADSMIGGMGDDTFIVDDAGDTVTENDGEGIDSVQSSVSFTLSQYVENLTLTGTAALIAGGNAENNILKGNAANNTLYGYAGNDTLDGGLGADTMVGGEGDDTYFVDHKDDVLIEAANEGIDSVRASVSWVLGEHFEHLTLTSPDKGTGVINGTGNALDNTIIGNLATNTLIGLDGNDYLDDGGGGGDRMYGGMGDDTYAITDATAKIYENAGEGTDTVILKAGFAGSSYTMAANIENLVLITTNASATGNALSNTMTGNAGNNTLHGGSGGNDVLFGMGGNDKLTTGAGDDTLDGGEGADTMSGGAGNNLYIVDNVGDVVIGGSGIDTVHSSVTYSTSSAVENLTLTGSANINATGNNRANILIGNDGNNVLNGGAGNDTLIGGDGDDLLIGGSGADTLTGGNDADTFLFDLLSAFTAIDTVTDFNTGEGDVIDISSILSGRYNPDTDDILDFVMFEDSGSDTIVSIDRDGAGTLYGFQQIALLAGVTGLTDEEALITNGNLIVGA